MLTKIDTMNRIEKRAKSLLERQKQAMRARTRVQVAKNGVISIKNN